MAHSKQFDQHAAVSVLYIAMQSGRYFNKWIRVLLLQPILLILILLNTSSAEACIEAYEHHNYGGQRWKVLCGGDTNHAEWNDKITSFKIPAGYKLTAWEHSTYDGKVKEYIGGVPNVGSEMNDKISSLALTSFDTSRCITTYKDANFKGEQFAFCPSGLTKLEHRRWNDQISSVRVPKENKVMFCEHSTGTGACRTYFNDVANLGNKLNDTFSSVKYGFANNLDFTMAILSDTQYDYCESDLCKNGPGNSQEANKHHSISVNTLIDQVGFTKFAGVIVNGDLTNTARKHQPDQFISDYQGLNLYLGLGNHDYDNYIDKWCDGYFMDGGPYRAYSKGFCAIRLLKWFEREVDSVPTVRRDYSYNGEDLEGSIAYSFDIGDWHFVQLNNHPDYGRYISSYDSWNVVFREFDIKKSLDWLKDDLARSPHKKVILNVHVMNAGRFNSTGNYEDYNQLGEIIDNNPQVVVIFAGHLHSRVGQRSILLDRTLYGNYYDKLTTPGGRDVPVFFSGSAETNWYLRTDFSYDSLTVTPINSFNGLVEPGVSRRIQASSMKEIRLRSAVDENQHKCLDRLLPTILNGFPTFLWDCNERDSQKWIMDNDGQIHSKSDYSKCLDPRGPSTAENNILMDVPIKYAGYTHVALEVNNTQAVVKHLDKMGIEISEGPVTFPTGTSTFIRDQDFNVIEFHEPKG